MRKLPTRRLPVVLALALAGFGLTAAPASATTDYLVSPTAACQYQYGPSSYAVKAYVGPFAWSCYSATGAPAGRLTNYQGYCTWARPGSTATWKSTYWVCRQT
jgi:hypothetical protein